MSMKHWVIDLCNRLGDEYIDPGLLTILPLGTQPSSTIGKRDGPPLVTRHTTPVNLAALGFSLYAPQLYRTTPRILLVMTTHDNASGDDQPHAIRVLRVLFRYVGWSYHIRENIF